MCVCVQAKLKTKRKLSKQSKPCAQLEAFFVISLAVYGCQQEGGIMDCNNFAQSKDGPCRKYLILDDSSCRVSKGHILIRELQSRTGDTKKEASSADRLRLIEPLLPHVKL